MLTSCAKSFGFRHFQLTMVNRAGEKIPITFNDGDRLFDVIAGTKAEELQGACGGNMACGGCHCILDPSVYTKPDDDENETLQGSSKGVTATSRLACNLTLSSKFDGTTITMGPL